MTDRWVLQFCHSHYGPFLDVARQYAVLFKGTPYKVLTVYLTGADTQEVRAGSASDEVLFLGNDKKDVRGLKLKAMLALYRIMRSRPIELVIAHRFKPLYLACLTSKVPVIGVTHAFGDYQRKTRQWFVNRFKDRLRLLGVSNAVRDDIRRCLPNWPENKIQTLYNRIDIEKVQSEQVDRDKARTFLGLPQDAYIVGNVGRLHPDKDQATLIRGFALALPHLPPPAKLVILGQGPLEQALKQLAQDLGVSDAVLFAGQIPHARRYFKAFDVFALTSDHEPFGMVLLEAMAAGIRIIASNCGGAPEIVQTQDQLFEFASPEDLAQKLSQTPAPGNPENTTRLNFFSDPAARHLFFDTLFKTVQTQ